MIADGADGRTKLLCAAAHELVVRSAGTASNALDGRMGDEGRTAPPPLAKGVFVAGAAGARHRR